MLQEEPFGPVLEILSPAVQSVPLVFASPHSGRRYPQEFVAQSALDAEMLRRSEDSFVDELFAGAVEIGAPMLSALLPRAFLDPNREPYELDPQMFEDPLPAFANTASPRVGAGLGTIAKVVSTGTNIYRGKLSFAEAERRIEHVWRPYHAALEGLIAATLKRFGLAILIDCHSMPSIGGPLDRDHGTSRVDFVLGDCYGTSTAPIVIRTAELCLRRLGYRVVRNMPYAGGYTTKHYGMPAAGRHCLQVEINRRLYMDEFRHEKRPEFDMVRNHLAQLAEALASLPFEKLGCPA